MRIPTYTQSFYNSKTAIRKTKIEEGLVVHLEQQLPLSNDYEELHNLAFFLIDTISEEAGWDKETVRHKMTRDTLDYFKAATAIACLLLQTTLQDQSIEVETLTDLAPTLTLHALEFLEPGSVEWIKVNREAVLTLISKPSSLSQTNNRLLVDTPNHCFNRSVNAV
ncbi:hypothetical protein ACQ4M3_20620 [Leptolyngbya sp. AN03gr2]|uniref:hypothetical protein n=1 Tax=unclassified Leptolyngbya TaxID=2650499 RepID=UPI003D3188AD